MPNSQNDGQEAVLSVNVDVANVSVDSIERLLSILPRYGRPLVLRAFGDFRREDLVDYAVRLFREGFSLVHCPSWPNGDNRLKSVVDDVLAQDLRDQSEEIPEIDTFVLVTGDRNFIAVANALKRHGKRIIVAAEETSINRELRAAAHEYIELLPGAADRSSLLQRARALQGSRETPMTLRDLVKVLVPEDRSGTGEERSRVANLLREAAERGLLYVASSSTSTPPQQPRRRPVATPAPRRRVTVLEGESIAAAVQSERAAATGFEPETFTPADFAETPSFEDASPVRSDFEDMAPETPAEQAMETQFAEPEAPAEETPVKRARPTRRRTRTPRARKTVTEAEPAVVAIGSAAHANGSSYPNIVLRK